MAAIRLIASAAYVEQELAAEFGRLPPAFLPIGVSRLYEAQVARWGAGGPIHLTIPDDFVPSPHDRRRLAELNVTLVAVPTGLRLGESLVYALNDVAAPPGPVALLHGDTLIDDLPVGDDDLIAVHVGGDDYAWAGVDVSAGQVTALGPVTDDGPVACGYFGFSSSVLLLRAMTRARGDFVAGLNLYAQSRPVRAVSVIAWHDFGHIQTYFRSRQAIVTARVFNVLHIDLVTVRKVSDDHAKMRAEAAWFADLPPAMQPYAARFLEADIGSYRIEYQYAPTLAELFVFCPIGRATWRRILASCHAFLEACVACRGGGSGDAVLASLAVRKTTQRVEQFARSSGYDIDHPTRIDGRALPSLRRIADDLAGLVERRSNRTTTVMHGDFCFSNILYNSRAGRICVIDPRGCVEAGAPTVFGDVRYDLAKLAHSVVGYYDHILAGRYALRRDGDYDFAISFDTGANADWVRDRVLDLSVDDLSPADIGIRAVTTGLFLSMLPLHADRPDRQAAFIANALRLYADLDGVRH